MGLVKAYYKWQRSIDDLEHSIKRIETLAEYIKYPRDKRQIKKALAPLQESFKKHKKSSRRLGGLIDKHF